LLCGFLSGLSRSKNGLLCCATLALSLESMLELFIAEPFRFDLGQRFDLGFDCLWQIVVRCLACHCRHDICGETVVAVVEVDEEVKVSARPGTNEASYGLCLEAVLHVGSCDIDAKSIDV
jgi:hypothetical protein